MSSPFSTIEEFNGAADGPTEGAIYTFAHMPIINILALLVAVGIFIWFIIATYSTHVELPTAAVDKSLNRLSSWIVIGLLSLVAADHRQINYTKRPPQASPETRIFQPARLAPLGLVGIVFTTRRQKGKRLARDLRPERSKR